MIPEVRVRLHGVTPSHRPWSGVGVMRQFRTQQDADAAPKVEGTVLGWSAKAIPDHVKSPPGVDRSLNTGFLLLEQPSNYTPGHNLFLTRFETLGAE